jgi:hypothetical protein
MPKTHAELREEHAEDLNTYMDGKQLTFEITHALGKSVADWPIVEKELVVFRGQPKAYTTLPTTVPFMSTSYYLHIAKRFAGDGGHTFKLILQPGVRFFVPAPGSGEAEVFVETGALMTYGVDKTGKVAKKRVKDADTEEVANSFVVTVSPKPTGGRRRQLSSSTRYTKRKNRNRLASWNPRIHTQRAMESSMFRAETKRQSGGGPGE